MITGKDLIAWGFTPGPWFKAAIERANEIAKDPDIEAFEIIEALRDFVPPPVVTIPRRNRGDMGYFLNMDVPGGAEYVSEAENDNISGVMAHMSELMRVPTIKHGAVMPDACPAGSAPGTIPVGGVVACENAIHPGYHSADICCSMAFSMFEPGVSPKDVLDAGMMLSHFGPGGRKYSAAMRPSDDLLGRFEANRFLSMTTEAATRHFGTQGDGNHFFYVGTVKSTGRTALVTHHGSRKPGALLYKAGMHVAERSTKKIAPSVPKHQAWIVADSEDGQEYWKALQLIRTWTKNNHFTIHDAVARFLGIKVKDRFWNEHNFVFQKPDGLFYHAKGATPAYPYFSADTNGLTLIPMNMSEPILITRGLNADNGLGFAPHGAGRNLSRTGYLKGLGKEKPTVEVDARWFSGTADHSEMPGAYKDAESVRRQIKSFGLAEIVDEVIPYGCIMAGSIDWKEAGKRLGDAA